MFIQLAVENVENKEDTANEYQEHATAADEQDQFSDDDHDDFNRGFNIYADLSISLLILAFRVLWSCRLNITM